MSHKELSRGPQIDMDLCTAMVGGRFDLVLIASTRAREISKAGREREDGKMTRSIVEALLEVQEGKIGREYLAKVKKQ